ncbi:MAG: zf-HC2 domain-containing protein [Cyanobacteria bacterium P01_F01_bin.143]
MTSRYDDFAEYRQPNLDRQDAEDDCFELLSAYIDGEATAPERQKVQQLLDNDPEIKKLYLQLLKLQGGMQNLAVPTTQDISADLLSQQVFAEVDRSRNRQKIFFWGGSLLATGIIAAISGLIPGANSPSLKLAESTIEETSPQTVMVAVSLNEPTVTIPKAAISAFPLEIESEYK